MYFIEIVALKNERFRKLTKGTPQMLIDNGELNVKVMNRNMMDVDEVRELLRMQNVFSLRSVKYAILENSGRLSVIRYDREESTASGKDQKGCDRNEITYLLVDAGKVEYAALGEIDRDIEWLRKEIRKDTGHALDNVFFAEWGRETGFFIQEKKM
ncbi:DUF421 domain-containing protein [Salinicoccus sesuvii]